MKTWMLSAMAALLVLGGVSFLLVEPLSRSSGIPDDDSSDLLSSDRLSADRGEAGSEASPAGSEELEAVRLRRRFQRRRGAVEAGGAETPPTAGESVTDMPASRRPIPAGDSSLEVVLLDASGLPLSDVETVLQAGALEARASVDPEGKVLFADIAAGTYDVRLLPAEGPELTTARRVTLAAGEEKNLVLRVATSLRNIVGRVLDRDGNPVPGITIEAERHLFQVNESQVVPVENEVATAVSGADGAYEIADLLDGEYELSTVATDRYASVRKIARAGAGSCDLILDAARHRSIEGRVRSPDGTPLAGVLILPPGQPTRQTRSDPDGAYALNLAVGDDERSYWLRFSAQGYRDRYEKLVPEDLESARPIALDVELAPIGETSHVEGLLLSSDGDPVPGETVYLHSPSLRARYVGTSDSVGAFVIEGVQLADDYRVWIHPKGDFADWSRYPLTVPAEGLAMEIVLEALGAGSVEGVVVDVQGQPQPDFRTWVRSARVLGRWFEVTAGKDGLFRVDRIPEGALVFDTRSTPFLRAQGAELASGEVQDVRLVVDWGTLELEGSVTDTAGKPLSGVRVELRWSHAEGSLKSSSHRTTTSDASGRFRFGQLGPGSHHLTASLSGYRPHRSTHDVGKRERAVRIELASED